ncbi:MAG TPA: CaiB/BaiF CoA-transferase family protein [Burkholderiales bacterium]|nr:CaiB/BaiF CoA-transferase family protein [Burkholderiales bacterium]
MPLPLSGLLVVSLEQAVAAPMCTCRLADAGARVIKVERPEGDFARYYDKLALPRAAMAAKLAATASGTAAPAPPPPFAAELGFSRVRPPIDRPKSDKSDFGLEGQGGGMQKGSRVQAHPLPNPPPQAGEGAHRASGEEEQGESAYFVWLNRGKESLVLDLARADDKALLATILARADVFVQNLKPGAIAKLGFPLDELRRAHPRLVICSISGYGEDGPYAARKAYDMLVQAESGLASVTGGPEAPARVGVSVCDIAAGMNAYEAILAALYARERTGGGAAISISMFDAMAEWMAVPLIQYEGGAPPKRMGLAHTSIAPYGAFKTRDGADILISIQSDREWRVLAEKVLDDKALAADPAFATNVERVKRRAETDARVAAVFGATDEAALTHKLAAADIAFARVNATADLAVHPQLRRIDVGTPSGVVSYPAPPGRDDGAPRRYGAVPALGEHTAKIWAEFLPHAPRPRE